MSRAPSKSARSGPTPPPAGDTTPHPALVGVGALAMFAALWGALIHAPSEQFQGDVQRLMYLHVPAALTMYLAVTLVFLGSVFYLWKRDSRWDEIGAAAAEVGTVFGTMVLLTGPMWARPIWGTWWTWDARQTTFFILWLTFVAYVMLRAYGGAPEQVARYCAVLGIIAFIDLPITHYSVTWWRTLHPEPVIMTEGGFGSNLPGSMLAAFGLAMGAFVLLFAALFLLRLRLERQERRFQALRQAVDDSRVEDLP